VDAKRKRRRRPAQKVLKHMTAEDLMKESEFRRWRYHAPDSLKRQAYEIIRKLVRQAAPLGEAGWKWSERVRQREKV